MKITNKVKRRPLVAVIGNAKLSEDSERYLLARETGRILVEQGFRILTGGLQGVMQAACQGAREAKNYSPGDTVALLPGLDPEEANPYVDIAIATGMGMHRNALIANADAVIAIGGGAGTLNECSFAWMYRRLIVAIGNEGWSGKLKGSKIDKRCRKVNVEEDRIFEADTPEEAVEIISNLWFKYRRRPGTKKQSS